MSDDRILDMIERRRRGETLEEIGTAHGLTRERVRQLLRGRVSANEAAAVRMEQTLQAARDDAEAILEMYRDGATMDEIARERWHTLKAVKVVIREQVSVLERRGRYGVGTTTQDREQIREQWIAWLQRYADEHDGRTPSVYGFRRWDAKGRPEPSGIQYHFESWAEACRAAGLRPNARSRSTYTRRWTDDQMLDAISRCWDERGKVPTFAQYAAWASERDEPSGSLVRFQLSVRWIEILKRVEQRRR